MRMIRVLMVAMALSATAQAAQDGATIYQAHCSSCHDLAKPRTPPLSALKAMSPAAVEAALTSGSMRGQAEGLTKEDIAALIAYVAPTGKRSTADLSLARTCERDAPHSAIDAKDWAGWSPGLTNARFQDTAAAGLTSETVPRLKVKWAFSLGAVTSTRTQPVVVGGRLIVTAASGAVYSLDAKTGCTYWGFLADSPVRASVTVGQGRVYFGDFKATVYALDADTGKLLWKVHPVDHPAAMLTATPRYYEGVIYQPFASYEEVLAAGPNYKCCTFRGSVVALDATTGRMVWQTFTIPEEAQLRDKSSTGSEQYGPSGAAVWSTPTIDEQRHALYVATGDNYSDPPTTTSDAVLAMDLKRGKLLWSRQLTPSDAYNVGCSTPQQTHCPKARGGDFDFGQPPILVKLGGRARALVIAQKSGMAHSLDPDHEGAILWQRRVGEGSALGGSEWGSASDSKNVYVATSDIVVAPVPDSKTPGGVRLTLNPLKGGGLQALELKTGKVVWNAAPAPCATDRTNCSPAQSAAVTVIPGTVFSGSIDGHLRAYATASGKVLWDFDTERDFTAVNGIPANGGSIDVGGVAVRDGMVFVSSGYAQWGGAPGNVVLAFSIDGE
ncbi:MAG TPA: PQQ-binding-like beta-propeller repeat protein [Steroidobacteraceae bacterium]